MLCIFCGSWATERKKKQTSREVESWLSQNFTGLFEEGEGWVEGLDVDAYLKQDTVCKSNE